MITTDLPIALTSACNEEETDGASSRFPRSQLARLSGLRRPVDPAPQGSVHRRSTGAHAAAHHRPIQNLPFPAGRGKIPAANWPALHHPGWLPHRVTG